MQWSGSNKMISRILILNVFDYQFANCLRPNLTFILGLVGYLEVLWEIHLHFTQEVGGLIPPLGKYFFV